jgi:uncharacterized membrane protein
MASAGAAHFVFPGPYERIVPRILGNQAFWVRASGLAEFGCAALLLGRRTAQVGGWATAALLVIVFPANVQMALDGGVAPGVEPSATAATLAWVRLPLQLPLILWAISVARSHRTSVPTLAPGKRAPTRHD